MKQQNWLYPFATSLSVSAFPLFKPQNIHEVDTRYPYFFLYLFVIFPILRLATSLPRKSFLASIPGDHFPGFHFLKHHLLKYHLSSTTMSVSEQPVAHSQGKPLSDDKPTYLWKKSFSDWVKHLWYKDFSDSAVEGRLLSYLPFFPESDGKRVAQIIDTQIGDGTYIHEFCIENIEKPDSARSLTTTNSVKDIVLVHGYAASLGLFLENFNDLSSIPGVRLHALDLPGFGLSSRPKYPNFSGSTKEDIYKNEDWFIDRLEDWRKKRGIERFVLIGHSFGGYLSCAYSLKYNKNLTDASTGISQRMIEKLILLSPVGVERHADALQPLPKGKTMAPEDELPQPSHEFTDDQEQIMHENSTVNTSIRSERLAPTRNESVRSETTSLEANGSQHLNKSKGLDKRPENNTTAMFKWMWEHNFSPFSVMRNIGPAKSKMVSMWTSRRFSHFYFAEPLKFQALHNYFYRIFNGKGSGEYAITRILAWGAVAKLPLLDRCPKPFVQMDLPTLWLYGDKDWMDDNAGLSMSNEINDLAESQGKGVLSYFGITPNAGHHLYLDNPKAFSKQIFDFLDV